MKAIWKGITLAESNETIIIEGNHYFPPESINRQHFRQSNTDTFCPWKGTASYYDIEAEEAVNENAAWYYPNPSDLAKNIKDYIAFWKGVEIKNE